MGWNGNHDSPSTVERERERETLIAACAAALCPDGAVRKNAQREHGGGKTTKSQPGPFPLPNQKKKKKTPTIQPVRWERK